ncbi:MAG: hypothetical protein ACYC0J_05790 [Gammaproteobacteria bacterium]
MKTGCLVLLMVVLVGCARHIEGSGEDIMFANQPDGEPAANAANTMISPLTG